MSSGWLKPQFAAASDILVLNKFGKQEIEGKGLRNAIAMAVDAGIPVLVGLNRANVGAWNDFCGGEGTLLDANTPDVEAVAALLHTCAATKPVAKYGAAGFRGLTYRSGRTIRGNTQAHRRDRASMSFPRNRCPLSGDML